ncbi:MAG: hypothetical protein J6S49_02205 [Erysipelotrichaceae bacterium]|nr:hypothetical protein [Erysipelotrichaceae bacterium]
MIFLSTGNVIDWNSIKAEYIAGGTSYRKLAAKHNISKYTLSRRAIAEQWMKQRQEAQAKATAIIQQKTAVSAADNAATAQRIKAKLLARLEKEIDSLPLEQIGTASFHQTETFKLDSNGKPIKERIIIEIKLRELTAAYKDLTADMMPEQGEGNELLQSLILLERRTIST